MGVRTVQLYGRAGCHLCEAAAAELDPLTRRLGLAFEAVDIDANPGLERAYRWAIPVVALDGREIARAPLRPGDLERALSAALASPAAPKLAGEQTDGPGTGDSAAGRTKEGK